jgi:hypothetical protein
MKNVIVSIWLLIWIGFIAGCSTIPDTNQGALSGSAQVEPVFTLDSKTVQSAKLKSFGDGGYGIHFILSDTGWSEICRISARRPSELTICIGGRTVTRVTDPERSGSPLWMKEGVWTGPAMDETGTFSIGVGHDFYGFSKAEAEELIHEILK